MRHIALALTLLLAGCSRQPTPFQAGQWEFDVKTTADGKPAFWGGGGQCISEAEAADLPANILSNTSFGQCTSSSANLSGGKLEISASCDGKTATTTMPASKVTLNASYTPTSFEGRVSAQLKGDTPVQNMSGTLSARRTGECSAPKQGKAS